MDWTVDWTDWLSIDRAVMQWTYGLPLPEGPVVAVTHVATRGGAWLLAGILLTARGRNGARRAGAALLTGLVVHAALVEGLVKRLVARERPFSAMGLELRDPVVNPDSYSFPSGHSCASFLGAWLLGARYPRWRWALLAIAVLVAASRVQLGAHYPTDVAVGAVFGLALGATLQRAFGVRPPEPPATPSEEAVPADARRS